MILKVMLLGASILIVLPFTPWWIIVIPAIITGTFTTSWKSAVFTGGLGTALGWSLMTTYRYYSGGQIIMLKVSEMFGLSTVHQLVSIMMIIAFVIGASSSLTGYFSRQLRVKL